MGLDHYTVYYHILRNVDSQLELVRADSVIGASIDCFEHFPSQNEFKFGLRSDDNERVVWPKGFYNIGRDMNLVLRDTVSVYAEPDEFRNILGHEYLHKLAGANTKNLFYTYPYSYKIIKLNSDYTKVIDTLHMPVDAEQIILFSYHISNDKIYVFNLNYEVHGKFTNITREPTASSPRVTIFDPEAFNMLETHEIADYPDGEYPGGECGEAEVAGDYIVYYFFNDDWMHRYNPAMLFIFDTRTNESSWLRVGWR